MPHSQLCDILDWRSIQNAGLNAATCADGGPVDPQALVAIALASFNHILHTLYKHIELAHRALQRSRRLGGQQQVR